MCKKSILFVGFTYDYELMDLQSLSDDYQIFTFSIPNRINFFLSKLLFTEKLYCKFIYLLLSFKIKKISVNKNVSAIITKDNLDYLNAIASLNYPCKRVLILRNILNSKVRDFIDKFQTYTFDIGDAEKYNLKIYNQYSAGVIARQLINIKPTYDISFVGKNKGRLELVNLIEKKLSNFSIYKYIVNEQTFLLKILSRLIPFFDRNVSYINYLEKIYSGTAILDIVQSGQSGITMRMIEGLSYNRKIITNNKSVLNHELYNKDNIYYFENVSNLNDELLTEFIKSKFIPYECGEIQKYSPQFILDKIIRENII